MTSVGEATDAATLMSVLSQIVAEIGELRGPVKAVFDEAPDAAMVPTALVTASEVVGALRVAAVVALLNESDDAVARQRQELLETTTPVIRLWDVAMQVSSGGIRGVILDVSGVMIVDSYLARVLTEIAADCTLLGAGTVVAGIQPAVAITLVEMGLRLDGARMARSLEAALAMFDDPGQAAGQGPGAQVGGILSARPGEDESGDGWSAWWDPDGLSVAIVDGLGHGPIAAEARDAGLRAAASDVSAEPAALLAGMDRQLSGGRGAVAAAARLAHGKLAFCGVGNIGARVGSGSRAHGLVSSLGTLGLNQRVRPVATMFPWGAGSVFIAHSDGVRPGSDLSRYPGLAGHDPAIMAALVWRDAVTRTDDAAVVVLLPAAADRTAGPAAGRA